MALNDPDFPMQFLVGRELALRQKADSASATRHALIGTMIAGGLFGPILARQLAIREAPSPVALPPAGGVSPSPGTGFSGAVDRFLNDFQSLMDDNKEVLKALQDEETKLQTLVKERKEEQTKMCRELLEKVTRVCEVDRSDSTAQSASQLTKKKPEAAV
ncbi:MAG: hypothetical protein HY820_01525 [Acidobacteria bacterium]|nr:hypothetical protein [Acidobacteriota bacterium]